MLTNTEILNSTQCRNDLIQFREAVDRQLIWSLKVIDASGEPTSGFVYGNNYWLGNKGQCEDAGNRNPFMLSEEILQNNSKYRHIEYEFPPFEVKFFVANFRHNSTLQYHIAVPDEDLIILGMCLPASCSKEQLSILLEVLLKNRTLFKGELYSADFTLVEVRDLIVDHRWLFSGTFITMTVIVVLTFLLMIIGTGYDVLIYQKRFKKDDNYLQVQENDNSLHIDSTQTLDDNDNDQMKTLKSSSFFCKIFQAFSVYSNSKRIFQMESDNTNVSIIHGLRFLSMVWIIVNHTVLYSRTYYDNKPFVIRRSEGFAEQLSFNGFIAVDTFLCFGGFLVSYLHLKKEMDKSIRKPYNYLNIIKLYFLTLLKRFIRLTPTYMIFIGLLQINTTWYSKTSLFSITERNHENCQKYWWRNLLYIQNFFSFQDMCISWSWYLAADMQLYVVSIFLLFLSSIFFKVAASLLGLLFTSSIILTGVLAYIYDWTPALDKQISTQRIMYYSPWVRIGPYFVGVITAYIVVKLNKKLHWNKKTILLFWILSILCNLLVLFGIYPNRMSGLTAAVYAALSRTVWAIGIAWIIIACSTNNGGIVNHILSWKGWTPFSKLTYAAYLLNPFLIISFTLLSKTSVHFDPPVNAISGLGYVVLTYICSYVASLMFEMPYTFLLRELMDKRR
ncbi:PREDICTED: nose resistant to fluoxetine protein 6-like [Polistes dominula]|uniref:Nose resistant to fluoxetine protein 6-like n=1 Tax=Polistes dominula TaxID=743375 RepID=A0ABM1IVL3_POLDO|nr:PREDICTED: nose resistant to fluoxetine protein 6-like [Polistes dominula]